MDNGIGRYVKHSAGKVGRVAGEDIEASYTTLVVEVSPGRFLVADASEWSSPTTKETEAVAKFFAPAETTLIIEWKSIGSMLTSISPEDANYTIFVDTTGYTLIDSDGNRDIYKTVSEAKSAAKAHYKQTHGT